MNAIRSCRKRPTHAAPRALLCVLTAVGLLAGCAAGDPSESGTAGGSKTEGAGGAPSRSAIVDAVSPALDEAGVPGAAILIDAGDGDGDSDGETLALIGEASPGRAVDSDTRFAYRSITKSVVGTVILQLAEEGAVDLDEPVSSYIDGVPGGERITVRELATMRSGLPNYSASPGLGELLTSDPGREPAVDELLELAFAEPADFAPGEEYEYSNTNTLLLGEVIEAVTGASWEQEVADRILRPLDMDSAAYGFTSAEQDATGFQLSDGEAEELPTVAPGWFGAAGGLTGDVRDLATWGRALGSGELLEETTQQERLEQFGSIDDDPQSPEYDRYGFAMGEIEGWIGHTGNGLGFQALVMYEPESADVVAILVNGTGEDPDLPAALFTELLPLLAE